MPMDVLTVLQTAELSAGYLLVTAGLPALVFWKKLQGHRIMEKFMLCFMAGNFYIINLVYLLQLLKISYPVTLLLGTLVPVIWGWIRLNQIPVRKIAEDRLEDLRKINRKSMGHRTARARIFRTCRKTLERGFKTSGKLLIRRPLDCILLLGLLGLLFRNYGNNLLLEYGYKMSDMPIHNYWVNAMGENHIFVAGVYPHGFHCVIYYLHSLLGMDTYNVLRLFGFVQTVMVHLMLLFFLKLCCRSRYAAYAGVFLYMGSAYFELDTYTRFYAALPQEFGMIFILPAVYCGLSYFPVRKQELAGEKESGKKSWLYLAGFAMSFSMTLTVHFYGTMVAGLFCAAMAIGYCFLFLRRKYFFPVVLTCLLSVLIAVFPMVAAFLGGTPLEGSLRWGMSVINGTVEQEEVVLPSQSETDGDTEIGENRTNEGQDSTAASSSLSETFPEDSTEEMRQQNIPSSPGLEQRVKKWGDRIRKGSENFHSIMFLTLDRWVLNLPKAEGIYWVIDSFFVLAVLGLLLLLLRQQCYGSMVLSLGIYLFFMDIMMAAHAFGLPSLMDSSRGSVYFSYSLPIVVAFLIDAVLELVFLPFKNKFLMHLLSLACVCLAVWHTWETGQLREPRDMKAQEMNEAITCMENIIETERDFTWTIVSANDELRMGTDHGYHYETITFLEDMEGEKEKSRIRIRIPTPVVYIFVEKIPLDYNAPYEKSGQRVSREGADHPLPPNSGMSMYQGEQRWILMSRMYYWAQEFERLYPNELDVYLETDQFVCYRIEQNMYCLYDFAIDYDYNTKSYQTAKE